MYTYDVFSDIKLMGVQEFTNGLDLSIFRLDADKVKIIALRHIEAFVIVHIQVRQIWEVVAYKKLQSMSTEDIFCIKGWPLL